MGLYCLRLKPGASERIPSLMMEIGSPVTRVEEREHGTYYIYELSSPISRCERFFWIHTKGTHEYWHAYLSLSSRKIAAAFATAGLFE